MENKLDKNYWTERYLNKETGWDVGYCTTPLKEYFDTLQNKTIKILIPGAGNAYEAEYLHKIGFVNVFVADLSEKPLENLKQRISDFPENHLLLTDFFNIKQTFNLIIEQTFFCALNPILRKAYAQKSYELLLPGGKLVGVMFNKQFEHAGPPFGGSKEEYLSYFSSLFNKVEMNECKNSIKPRLGSELFVELTK